MQTTSLKAGNESLVNVPSGAVVALYAGKSDPIIGVAETFLSADGVEVSLFGTPLDGVNIPLSLMRKSDVLRYEVVANSIDEFSEVTGSKDCHGFYEELCKHFDWTYDISAALNVVYWLRQNYTSITQEDVISAAKIVDVARDHFFWYVKGVMAPVAAA